MGSNSNSKNKQKAVIKADEIVLNLLRIQEKITTESEKRMIHDWFPVLCLVSGLFCAICILGAGFEECSKSHFYYCCSTICDYLNPDDKNPIIEIIYGCLFWFNVFYWIIFFRAIYSDFLRNKKNIKSSNSTKKIKGLSNLFDKKKENQTAEKAIVKDEILSVREQSNIIFGTKAFGVMVVFLFINCFVVYPIFNVYAPLPSFISENCVIGATLIMPFVHFIIYFISYFYLTSRYQKLIRIDMHESSMEIEAFKETELKNASDEFNFTTQDMLDENHKCYNEASKLYEAGKFDEALEEINRAIVFHESHGPSYTLRGKIFIALADKHLACVSFHKGMQCKDEEAEILHKKHCDGA